MDNDFTTAYEKGLMDSMAGKKKDPHYSSNDGYNKAYDDYQLGYDQGHYDAHNPMEKPKKQEELSAFGEAYKAGYEKGYDEQAIVELLKSLGRADARRDFITKAASNFQKDLKGTAYETSYLKAMSHFKKNEFVVRE